MDSKSHGMERCGSLLEMGQMLLLIHIMVLIGLVLEQAQIFLQALVLELLGMEQCGLQLDPEQMQLLIHTMV